MQVTRWSGDRSKVELNRLISTLKSEGLHPTVMSEMPGAKYDTHNHAQAEIRWLVKGTMTLGVKLTELEGKPVPEGMEWLELELEAGDRVDLPAETDHWALVGPQGVTYLVASR